MKGRIVRIIRDRGFGFVRDDEFNEYFFHATGLVSVEFDDLVLYQRVEFELGPDPRNGRERAIDVTLVEAGEEAVGSGSRSTRNTHMTRGNRYENI